MIARRLLLVLLAVSAQAVAADPQITVETETVEAVAGEPGLYAISMTATGAGGPAWSKALRPALESTAAEMALDYWQNEERGRDPSMVKTRVVSVDLGEQRTHGDQASAVATARVRIEPLRQVTLPKPGEVKTTARGRSSAYGDEKKKLQPTKAEKNRTVGYAQASAVENARRAAAEDARKAGENAAMPTAVGKPECKVVKEGTPKRHLWEVEVECVVTLERPFDRKALRSAIAASTRRKIRVQLEQTVTYAGGTPKTPYPTTLARTPLEQEVEADGWKVVLGDAPADFTLKAIVRLEEQSVEGLMAMNAGSFFPVSGQASVSVFDVRTGTMIGAANVNMTGLRPSGQTALSYERTAFNLVRHFAPEILEPLRAPLFTAVSQ